MKSSPSPSRGLFRVLVSSLLSFAILTAPFAPAMAANLGNTAAKSPAAKDAKNEHPISSDDATARQLFVNPPAPQPVAEEAAPQPAAQPFSASVVPLLPPATFTAQMSWALAPADDANSDGNVDPGDKISYTVSLSNQTGSDATALSFTVPLDTHTTLSGAINSTPVAFDLAQTPFNEDSGAQTITLSGQDPDGSNLTFSIVQQPAHSTANLTPSAATCGANGVCTATVSYTPAADYSGSDSFTFKVNDGTADSNQVGSVSITINSVNDAPTFTVPASNPASSNEDAGAQTVSNYISGIRPAQVGNTTEDTQTVSFEIVSNSNPSLFSSGPTLTVNAGAYPRTANLTYTAAANQNGTATITYRAKDDGGTANGGVDTSSPNQTFTITVNAVNDPPVVVGPGAFSAQANMKVTGLTGLLGNVTDADSGVNGCNPTFSVSNVSATSPAGGTISNLNASTGTFDFDPPPGVTGAVTFTYTVTDTGCPGNATSSPATTVTVNVAGPVIWFVNLGAASNGDGRLSSPFNSLASANTKLQNLGTNERIFLYTTDNTKTQAALNDQANLQASQGLIGQAATGTNFDTFFGITPPAGTITRPSINSATRTKVRGLVTMHNSTVVNGVDIDVSGASAGTKGLISSGFTSGTSSVVDVSVTSGTGNAVDISGTQTFTYTGSNNVLSASGGIALNFANTTIGAGGLNFKSISANGGTNGIVLNNTGSSGSLTVTGNSGTCNSTASTCTGGTIQSTTGAGIALTSTKSPSFSFIKILNTADSGIKGVSVSGGSQVSGFTLTNSVIDNSGTGGGVDTANVAFNMVPSANETNLTGTVSITNNRLTNARYHGIDIQQLGGTIDSLTITGNTLISSANGAVASCPNCSLGSGVRIGTHGTASAVASITKGTISNNTITNFPSGGGIIAQGGNTISTSAPAGVLGSAGVGNALVVNSNTIAGPAGVRMATQGVNVSVAGRGSSVFDISSNTVTDTQGVAIAFNGFGNVTGTGTMNNNTLTSNSNVNGQPGINIGSDIQFTSADTPNVNIKLDGNTTHATQGNGIQGLARGNGTLNITIINSHVDAPLGGVRPGIRVDSGNNTAGENTNVCVDIRSNTSAGSGGTNGIGLRKQGTNSAVNVYGVKNLSPSPATAAQTSSFVSGQNPSGNGVLILSGDNFVSCTSSPAMYKPEGAQPRDYLAQADNLFEKSSSDSLLAFLNIKPDFASIIEDAKNYDQSAPIAPVTAETQPTWLAPVAAEVFGSAAHDDAAKPAQTADAAHATDAVQDSAQAEERQTTVSATASTEVNGDTATATTASESAQSDSVYASRNDSAQLGARITRVFYQPAAEEPATAVAASAATNDEVSLSHGRSVPAKQPAYVAVTNAPLAPPTPPGSFPINGTGSGFRLPSGKTVTITFKVTVNNPPNLAGVNPPKVSQQGTLQGSFAGSPIVTDDPSTVTANDATVTPIDLTDTTTTVSSSQNPSFVGQNVQFTAVVAAPGGSAPTGSVQFKDGGSNLGSPIALTPGGTCPGGSTCATATTPNISNLSAGTHTITADYTNADGNFDSGSGTLAGGQVVNAKTATTTTVSSSLNPSNVGDAVTFTAKVNSASATGTVQFWDGPSGTGIALGSPVALTTGGSCPGGNACASTAAISNLTAGTHTITADYSGDVQFNASSGTLSPDQTVNKKATTTVVGSSPNPANIGESVALTATVSGSGGTPTGTVQFKDGGSDIGSPQALNGSGIATLNTSFSTSGAHSITAFYGGDATFLASDNTASAYTQNVNTCVASTVVTNTSDSGAGSLRAAIGSICSGGTVTFNIPTSDPNFSGGVYTIKLTSGEIGVNQSMTITGLGASALIVSGEDTSRVFNVALGKTVVISGMTITKGKAANGANDTGSGPGAGSSGGAITNSGTLTLTNVVVSNSHAGNGGTSATVAGGDGGAGGGIYNVIGATLTINGSTISGNQTGTGGTGTPNAGAGGVGGGIYSLGDLTINNSTFNGNKAIGLFAEGGGLDSEGGTLAINNSTISGNTSDGQGGGLLNCGTSTATLTGVTITGNISDNDNDANGVGGGIGQVSSNTLTLRNTIVAGNFKGSGGGVKQVETATVVGTIGAAGAGNAKVVVTAAGMTNSPKTVTVAVANNDTAADVAGKMRTALAADADVSAFFTVSGANDQIVLTANTAAANDPTMNIATDNDTSTGLTPEPTSADTVAGVAPSAADDIFGSINTASGASSFNLIGDAGSSGGLSNGTDHNIVGALVANVLNTTLADNGGPTKTHDLVDNSPAIDKGFKFGLGTDQRGYLRPVDQDDATYPNASGGDASDIGAVERQAGAKTPSDPVLDASSGGPGNTTNDSSPTFNISNVDLGATVQLLRDDDGVGGNPPAVVATGFASSNTIQLTDPGPLAYGTTYAYSSQQTLGGDTKQSTGATSITLNTTPSAPDLDAASDSGADSTDNITNVTTNLSFTVTGVVSGATVELLRDDDGAGGNPPAVVATGTASGASIQLIDPGPVSSGNHLYTAHQKLAGDSVFGASSSSLTVTIAITPDAPDLLATSDSGASNSDNNTKNTSLTFNITNVVNGATVELLRDGVAIGAGVTGTASGTTIQLTDPSAPSGSHTYTARQTVNSTLSPQSSGLIVTIDTTQPAPSVPDLKDASDTGTSNSDNRTNATPRDFTIASTEAGSLVELLRDGNPVAGAGASAAGTGSAITLTDAGALADGTYAYSTRETDLAGNVGTSSTLSVTIDTTGPSVSSVTRVETSPTNLQTVHFTVTFSEPVTGVNAPDFVLTTAGGITTASITGVSGSGTTYTVTVDTGSGDGTLRLDVVNDNSIKDVMNLALTGGYTSGEVYTISKSDPFVSSITRVESDPTNLGTVHYTVTFSKSVTGVDTSDFALVKTGGITTESITGVTGANASYTVTVNTGTGDGTLGLNLVDNDSIQDAGNRKLGGTGTTPGNGDGSFTGEVYTIDKTKPTMTVTKDAGQADPATGPTSSTVINFTVTFNESVTGLNSADVALSGTAGATVANVSGSGTTYTVGVEGMTQSGTVTITVSADAAFDAAGNGNTSVNPTNTATVNFIKDDFASFEVNSTADTDNGQCEPAGTNNGCTLREAINAANADGGAETITFDPAVFTIPGPHVINLSSALPDIASDMTINGPGANVLTVKRDTGGDYRIFNIASGNNNVTVNGLTLNNGKAAGLTLGGGISNSSAGIVNIVNSAITGSSALQGGGINKDGAGTLNITNSTISGNSGAQGGGINISSAGTVNITNSTLSGNSSTDSGGGISTANGTLTISNSTITDNRADSNNNGTGTGGGISRISGTVTLRSSIVARNYNDASPSTTPDDISGTVDAASSFNLIGNGGSGTLVNGTNSNQVGVADPGLNALADNGGPTQTHALQCVSPAIDKGNAFGLTADQRGLQRTFDLANSVYPNAAGGDGTDIGSFESQSGGGCIPVAVGPNPAPSTNEDTPVTITLTGTYSQNTPLSFTITQQPSHGTLGSTSSPTCSFNSGTSTQTCTATVQYTPASNYNGPDAFKFKVSAGGLDSGEEDVSITVNAVNDPPVVPISQAVATNEDTAVVINLSGSDVDSATLSFSVVTGPTHGTLSSFSAPDCTTTPGTCTTSTTYTPNANYGGSDGFTFKANDGSADSNTGAVNITVNPVNDSPVLDNTGNMTLTAINEDIATASNTGTRVFDIIASAGGDRITDADAGSGEEGIAVIGVDNTNGTWQFSIDNGVNWTPFGAASPTTARLLAARITPVNQTTRIRFVPNANFNGTVNPGITFRAWDQSNGPALNGNTADASAGGGSSPYSAATETASITVNPINDAPTADSQSVSTNEDTPLSITLTGTDVETAPANFIFTITQQPTHGVLSGTGANRTYTPASNYNGPDSFKFTITDTGDGSSAALTSAEATVSITVNAVNDPPVNTVPGAQSTVRNSALAFNAANTNLISIADVDAGGNLVQVSLTATNGKITLSGTSGLSFTVGDGTSDAAMTFTGTITNINNALNGLVFDPTPGFDGLATLQIVTNDQGNTGSGGAQSDTDTVNITVLKGGELAFSSAAYTVNEADGTATITVTRTNGTNGTTKVDYATSNGTAVAGQDYTATSGTLTFNNGETTKTFTVAINNDQLNEANETVNLTLSNISGSGAPGSPLAAVLTIIDNDGPPSLSINDVSLNEGNSGTTAFNFTVTLSAVSGQTVTVNYATANGTATAPSDYTATSGTLSFAPGETQKTITVLVNGDTTAEANETFFVNLSGAVNAPISDNQGLGTILSEDTPLVEFSSPTYNVAEDALRVIITVNRLGDLSKPATVDYATSDPSGLTNCDQVTGNASSRCDYATSVGILRFAAGESTKTISIPIVNDVYVEGPEAFTITLSNPTGAELAAPSSAVITIDDNDNGGGNNPIDDNAFFIRQLYIDFLGREPDPPGLQAWLSQLNNCQQGDETCDRVHIAEGFARSDEFAGRGYFIYRAYRASLGRKPNYAEFIPDMAKVSGFLTNQELEANKQAFINEFVTRSEFRVKYDSLDNASYVNALEATALVTLPNKQALIDDLNAGRKTRAEVLRAVMETAEVYAKYYNEAFVVMEYFGFLRRDPDAAYQDWINQFNHSNSYRAIIGGFVNSLEYRFRFGR